MTVHPMRALGRRPYAWFMVILLVAAPIIAVAAWAFYPGYQAYARYVNTGVFACVAVFTGARLADAGYARWVGIAGVVAIGLVLPGIAGFVAGSLRLSGDLSVSVIGAAVLVALLGLVAFVVWAATRPSISANADFDADEGRFVTRRIEPHF